MARPTRLPAKDLRPGDWVHLFGNRRRVETVSDEPPRSPDGSCYTREGNVWVKFKGRKAILAILRDELVEVERN